MINNTKKIKELYENIQRKLFDIVPGKWDELYLYASIIERLGKVQVGEMYFYFMPRGILKRKFINVYEVPNKYNIEEEEYLKLVELLYDEIKELREEFRKTNQKVWSNLTISIKNDRITYTFCYDNLLGGQDEYYDHHIYWRKKYLHIEPCGKKEEKAFNKYLSTRNLEVPKSDEYTTGIYLKRQVNVVKYDTTDVDENQRVDYRVAKQEESKIKNQIFKGGKIWIIDLILHFLMYQEKTGTKNL